MINPQALAELGKDVRTILHGAHFAQHETSILVPALAQSHVDQQGQRVQIQWLEPQGFPDQLGTGIEIPFELRNRGQIKKRREVVRIDLEHGTINRLSHLDTPVTIMTQGYLVKIVITTQNRTF
ncbi:hypothetical protein AY586_16665 [Marichromatium gracile]|uniref:Uncharacterized protein n=1 Tax=Marichromatium gracile TaxID=1048 RepID=A0ABR5VG81_MARGR|nr:hypothetical protein AY586_16665 [Marichromatium gracile]